MNSNRSGRCRKDATNTIAEIQAAKYAIEQASGLNIRKLCIYTDCSALVDAVNGNIAKWKNNGWRSLYDQTPIQNRSDYEEIDRLLRSLPIDIKFTLLRGHSGNEHHNEADKLARKGAIS